MVYVQRVKDKVVNKKRKKDSDRYEKNSIITYKKSKKRKIRREEGEESIPAYIFSTDKIKLEV